MNPSNERREKCQALVTALADVFDLVLRQACDRETVTPVPQALQPAPPATLTDDRLWDVGDVAKFLQASRSWVYKAAEVGTLPCLRIGAMLRFEPHAIMGRIGLDLPDKPSRAPPMPRAHQRPAPMSFAPMSTQPTVPGPTQPPAWSPPSTLTAPPPLTQSPAAPPRPLPLLHRPIGSLLSARQAAAKLGVCTATLYKLCETGELRHHRISNAIKVAPEDLERLRAIRSIGDGKGDASPRLATSEPIPKQT